MKLEKFLETQGKVTSKTSCCSKHEAHMGAVELPEYPDLTDFADGRDYYGFPLVKAARTGSSGIASNSPIILDTVNTFREEK